VVDIVVKNEPKKSKEQREVLRALEELKEQERSMYELDNRKDQVMTICKVTVANIAMWARDHYFPASYAQATWKRLLPFFQLPGTIHSGLHDGAGRTASIQRSRTQSRSGYPV
jgi:hypothetical protein